MLRAVLQRETQFAAKPKIERFTDLSDVFDDHLLGGDRLLREQTPVVDAGASERHRLLAELQRHNPRQQIHQMLVRTTSSTILSEPRQV